MPITNPDYSDLNYTQIAQAIGLKEKHMPLLIGSFIEESTPILENLKTAISSSNFEDIKAFAHSIKGSSGNLKFTEVYDMAREIELAAAESNSAFDYSGYLEAISSAVSTIKV